MKNSFLKKLLFFFVLSFLMMAGFTYGIMSARRQNLPYKFYEYLYEQKSDVFSKNNLSRKDIGRRTRNKLRGRDLTDEQRKAIEKITTLPYLKGYKPAPEVANVTIYDEQSAYNGLNLVVSADAPRALLMNMKGTVLHEWRKDFEDVWPEPEPEPEPYDIGESEVYLTRWGYKTYWKRVRLLNNGELLAIFTNFGLIKIDKDSNLLWSYKGMCHHDLFVAENGNIYVLVRKVKKPTNLQLESLDLQGYIIEDFITILSPEGKKLREISLLECFRNSEYAPLLEHIKVQIDLLHTNTVRPIDGKLVDRYPMFKKGHILISMREIHTIAIVDPEHEKITWALTGMWAYQHEPRLLENGNLLLFDNRGNNGKSKVIEVNPLTQEVVWSYKGEPGSALFSKK
ncbi:aryl-sulfate sulfotransferase, partial [candidate division KSB1 bacterium]|nr:aryl-sulfate sulfotransferase [candidate division KSB1 bacterium]